MLGVRCRTLLLPHRIPVGQLAPSSRGPDPAELGVIGMAVPDGENSTIAGNWDRRCRGNCRQRQVVDAGALQRDAAGTRGVSILMRAPADRDVAADRPWSAGAGRPRGGRTGPHPVAGGAVEPGAVCAVGLASYWVWAARAAASICGML